LREKSRFATTFGRARDDVIAEISRLGGKDVIISSNIPLRRDGYPMASARTPTDVGIAVYFTHKGKQLCFANDKYTSLEGNITGIARTIEALRGIARWGTGDMMESAFTGFQALPSPSARKTWQQILNAKTLIEAEHNYKNLARIHHPDFGGDATMMAELNNAIQEARAAA
jgi:hypothetical protein